MVFIKKRCHKAISMFLIMTIVFTSVLGLTGCKKDEETKAETVETAETEAVNTDEVVKDLDKIYECELVMGEGMTMMLYLKIDDKGNFVFSRNTDFSSDEKGAGKVYKNKDGGYYMEYSVVNGEKVEPGEYVTTFEINEDDTINFTSPMWFGSTSPSYEVDGKEVYPSFIVSDEEEITDGEKESETEEEDGDASDFRTGIYGGTYNTTAMGNPLTYSCTIRFNANGTYTYTVKFHIMGSTRTETESGTYTQNGTTINMVSNSGTSTSARITTSGLALTRYVSSFAFSAATISMTYGYTPGVVINNSGNTSESESEKETLESETSGTTDNENQDKEPEIDESITELVGGTYAVDISWSPMASMISPVLSINKAAMTFDIYNKSNTSASKGAGTITEENGVYTLNYENGNKVTFTFAGGVITFTSPLYYGAASFNSATVSGGDFVPYTATIIEVEGTVPEQPEESESETETEKESETETEKEPENEPESETVFVTGNYGGEYTNVSSSGKETDYTYTLTLNEDGTYEYTSVFAMGATTYTQTESGTYAVEDNVFTLTSGGLKVADPDGNVVMESAAAETMTGTIDATGKASAITRYVSYFAAMSGKKVELPLIYGFTPSTDEPTVELYTVEPGTYAGIHMTAAMGSNVEYVCQLVLNEDGTYAYSVAFTMMGNSYTQNETGTYTSSNNTITFSTDSPNSTKDGANENTATIAADNMFILNRYISSFASSKVDVVYKVGEASAPSVPESGTDSGKTEDDSTTENTAVITSGAYNVDISWSPMASYFSPVLSIDGDKMTFNVYNATAPETSKGAGTITETNGVFTLNYDNGNTTMFTYAGGIITFTSKLWYGAASFERVDDNGSFVSYTASMNGSGSGEIEEIVAIEPGIYGSMYSTTAMSSTIDYAITLTLNEDKTYNYSVAFKAMGSQMTQSESGTYVIDGTTITLTSSSSEINKDTTITGTVTGTNTFTLTRHVSSFASSAVEIQFTVGASTLSAIEETVESETAAETESETAAEIESETESEIESETAVETESEAETETAVETESETAVETESETAVETESETESETPAAE